MTFFLVILCFSIHLGSGGESSDTENAAAKCGLIKSLNITNAENLEARVRKELEEQGQLNKYMSKRRKKNSSKDRKALPWVEVE